MKNGLVVGIISIVVVVVVLGSVLMPVLNDSYQMEGVTISNDGANDVKLAKFTSGFGLDLSVSYSGDDVTIVNGTDTITTTADPQIILATESAAIFFNNDGDAVCVWHDSDTTSRRVLSGDFTAVIADDKLTVDDGTASDLPVPATYMYVPSSTGVYGSFNTGGLNKLAEDPVIAVGDFAGVGAYNQYTSTIDLNEHVTASSTEITSVLWDSTEIVPDEVESIDPFDPSSIVFDPGVIDLDPFNPGVSIMSVPTPTYTDGDWGYDLSGSNAIIVSYSGSAGDITVPSTVGGHTVTTLGKGGNSNVFDTSLSNYTVTIPSSITSINTGAFIYCTGLTSVTIPSSVTTIGGNAFYGCAGLTSVSLATGLIEIGSQAFYGCTGLTTVTIPSGVTSIKDSVFYNCTGLTTVTIPSGVTTIQNATFYGCSSLTTVTIPSGVTSIGINAFRGCSSLTSVTIPYGVTTINSSAFNECTGLTSVTIPSSVTTINNSAFEKCTSLTSVTIPSGVTSIKDSVFYNCTSLTSVTIPSSVTSIETTAFSKCTSLTSVTIPSSVTTIGNYAFRYSGITEVLNLSSMEITGNSYGLSDADIRSNIIASSYLAPVHIDTYGRADNAYNDLLAVIPLLTVVALVAGAIGWTIYARRP